MEVFQYLVKDYPTKNVSELTEMQRLCGNVKLNGSEFSRLRYCEKNFNNIAKAYMILFDLTVVNQWHGIFFICKYESWFFLSFLVTTALHKFSKREFAQQCFS